MRNGQRIGRGPSVKHQGSQKPEGSPRAIPRRRGDLNVEELDGEAVLYDPRRQAVHRFDAVTLFVWDSCDGSRSVSEIASAVVGRFAVGQDAALAQVERIVAELGKRGLLEQDCATDDNLVPSRARQSQAKNGPDSAELTTMTGGHTPDGRSPARAGLTRREAVSGGVAKLVFIAPVISTFWARTAYAETSNPIHPGSPFGDGGCKNVGFSCVFSSDCCGGIGNERCEDNGGGLVCCVRPLKPGCVLDEDCCDFPADTCNAGTCN